MTPPSPRLTCFIFSPCTYSLLGHRAVCPRVASWGHLGEPVNQRASLTLQLRNQLQRYVPCEIITKPPAQVNQEQPNITLSTLSHLLTTAPHVSLSPLDTCPLFDDLPMLWSMDLGQSWLTMHSLRSFPAWSESPRLYGLDWSKWACIRSR